MVIVLSGSNHFALQQELARLEAAFREEYGDVALERLDGEEAGLDQLQAALTSLPFLAAKKMVVLRAPSANKQFTAQAEQLLAGAPETTDVVLVEPKPDKRSAYYKWLKKNTDFREYADLDANGLARWAAQYAAGQGGTLRAADARLLVERAGPNQELLRHELDKLLLFNPAITRQTIEELTEATPQSTVFALLDAAFAGNARRALQLYQEQRALKVDPQAIIGMLAWQLHILALVCAAGPLPADAVASRAKLSPFVLRKNQAAARRLSAARLKKLVADLLALDMRAKTAPINLDEALRNYLLAISAEA